MRTIITISILLAGFFAVAPPANAATGPCNCQLVRAAADEAGCRALCEGVGMTHQFTPGPPASCACSNDNMDVDQCLALNREDEFLCFGEAGVSGGGDRGESSVDLASLNPLGETDIRVIIGRIIKYALGIVGSLALLMFIYGGGLWLLSGGQSERIEKGRNTILWATIGLGVIFASYALVNFVIKALTS